MAGNNLDTSIIIRAGVEGLGDLNQLLDAIEKAGGDVNHLRDASRRLGDAWNSLSTEEQTRKLKELADSTLVLNRQTNTATQSMERLFNVRTSNTINAEIDQVNASLVTLRDRFNNGNISQEEFNRLNQAAAQRLRSLQGELGQTSQSMESLLNVRSRSTIELEIAQVNRALGTLQQQLRDGAISQSEFNRLQQAAEQQLQGLRSELGQTSRSLEQMLNIRPSTAINAEIANINQSLVQMQQRLAAGAISQAEFNRLNAAAQQRLRELRGELGQAENSMERLFNIRPSNVIQGEITQINNALVTLGQRLNAGTISQEEFNRMQDAAQQRLRGLQSELGQTSRSLEQMLNIRSSSAINGEIDAINQSLNTMRQRLEAGSVSQQEFNRINEAAQQRLRELRGELNQASSGMERLFNVRPSNAINTEINEVNNALGILRQRLNAGTISQEEFNRLTRAGEARLEQLQNELNGTTRRLDETDKASKKAGDGMSELHGAVGKLQGVLGALGVSVGAMEIIALADQFKTLEAKVKLATGEGVNFITGFEGVQGIADRTFTSVNDTGELFARISQAGEAMNLSQKDTLQITESINQAIQLSGGTAESNQAAITQLIQGLQSGVVRGEEFNSLMEQSPRLSKAMADGLGVTRAELRALANDGQLTGEVVIKSIQSQRDVIENEFTTLPTTVENALVQLKNQFIIFVGDVDKQLNGSSGIASMIQGVATSLSDVDKVSLEAIKQSFVGLKDGVFAVVGLLKQGYDGITDFTNALGGVDEAAEKVGFLTRVMQGLSIVIGTVADGFKAVGIAFDLQAGAMIAGFGLIVEIVSNLTGHTNELAQKAIVAGDEMLARAKKNALEFESSAGEALKSAAKTQQDILNETAVKAKENYEKMATSSEASAEKQEAAFAEMVKSQVAANGGLIDARMALQLAERGLQGEIDKTGSLILSTSEDGKLGFAALALKAQDAGIDIATYLGDAIKNAKTKDDLDAIIVGMKDLQAQGKVTGGDVSAAMQEVAYKQVEIDQAIQKNIAEFKVLAQESIVANKGVISSELEKQAAARGLKVVLDEQKNLIVSVADTSSQKTDDIKKQYATVAKQLGLDFNKAMMSVNESFEQSGESLQKIAKDTDKFKAAGIDASNLIVQGLQNMQKEAKTTADYEYLIKLWEDLGKQGKITGQDLTDGLTAAKDKLDEMKDGINSVNEAYKVLGLQTKEQIAAQAASYKEAYEMIVNDGNASASQLQAAFEKYAKSAVAANKDVASSQLQSEAAARGLTVAVDESGRVSVEKSKDIIKSNRDVSQSINNVADSAFGIGKGIEKSVDRGITALGKLNKQLGETEARNKAIQEASAASSQAMNDSNGAAIVKSFENNKGLNTREGMLDFLRQTGIAAERAEKEVAALMYQFGGSGTMNWNRANGVPEGIQMSIEELAKYKMPSKYLLDLSKTIKAQEAARLEDEKRIQANEDFSRKQIELDKQTRAAYAELNKVRGDDRLSFEVQQTNKLDDIRNKILTAQREGDAESAYHYQKMLEIQQAINAEESNKKDALSVSKAQEESARARAKIEKEARDLEEKPRQAPKSYEQSINTTSLAREVVSSLDERIKQAKAEAIVEFSKQLMDEAKRLAR